VHLIVAGEGAERPIAFRVAADSGAQLDRAAIAVAWASAYGAQNHEPESRICAVRISPTTGLLDKTLAVAGNGATATSGGRGPQLTGGRRRPRGRRSRCGPRASGG
jgi:hypothetical protein